MSEQLDTQAIAAVRIGEIDRFRELVERYERHVYAVAWARLGDATLAEDETHVRMQRFLDAGGQTPEGERRLGELAGELW